MTTPSHPPAVKVAGRRLSVTSRSKPSHSPPRSSAAAEPSSSAPTDPNLKVASSSDDYPRPLSSAQAAERHTSSSSLDYQPVEGVRHGVQRPAANPAKHDEFVEVPSTNKGAVRGARIDQPASKPLGL